MVEPLLGHRQLVATCEPDARLVTVRQRRAGPAGSAGLDLGAGVELDVDVADPTSVAGLTVELATTGDAGKLPAAVRRRLDVLLGPERAAALAGLVRAAADRDTVVEQALPSTGAPAGSEGGVAPALQRAALAHRAACEPGAPRLVRAVALLDAAAALGEVWHRLDLRAAARHDAGIGADLLLGLLADDEVTLPGPRAAAALVPVLRQAARLLDGQPLAASRLKTLARDIERGRHPVAVASRRSPVPVAAGPRKKGLVDLGALPGALAEAGVEAVTAGHSHVEVRVPGWSDRRHGLWAQAVDTVERTIVAMAPLGAGGAGGASGAEGADAVAVLLVPPLSIPHLAVDVTDRPGTPRPSPALAAVTRAVHLGAVAARAARLGDRAAAERRWRQCARAWQAAGDGTRADQALAHAARGQLPGADQPGAVTALVSDLFTPGGPTMA